MNIVSDITPKHLVRKKSTSNFLCNFGIMEKPEHESEGSNFIEGSDDRYLDEINQILCKHFTITNICIDNMKQKNVERNDSNDFIRENMLNRSKMVHGESISYMLFEMSLCFGNLCINSI